MGRCPQDQISPYIFIKLNNHAGESNRIDQNKRIALGIVDDIPALAKVIPVERIFCRPPRLGRKMKMINAMIFAENVSIAIPDRLDDEAGINAFLIVADAQIIACASPIVEGVSSVPFCCYVSCFPQGFISGRIVWILS
jgi:hypothetical protein